MKNNIMPRRLAAAAAAAVISVTAASGNLFSQFLAENSCTETVFAAESALGITKSSGGFESAFIEWPPVMGASGYNVYCDGVQLDTMLIRQYPAYFRADAIGIKAGSHTLKAVPVVNGREEASLAASAAVNVTAHDRSGFGFVNGSSNGAYNSDGTLKNDAVVIYVTEKTKDSVKLSVKTDSKGNSAECTGIQNILTAYQKGYESRPLCIRVVGNITDPAELMAGDLLIKGSSSTKRLSCGVTVEGIGSDATFNGFGLRIANCSNIEVRNLGFMNCNSDEGDDVGLQQNNDHIWVHNCDFFYGDAGSDADQVKGDGALDTKTSSYITHSYNHFWDNGKCNLQGMKSETAENFITYHHNWYDHSDSRHPRIRTCTVHSYNNYFDGNAKYGVGVTMGASAFVENNYFRNCKYPMLISMQGSDTGTFSGEDGGVIKAFGNCMTGQKSFITYQQDNSSFDAYAASSRSEKVPSSVKAKQGGTVYNNFDTAADMYSYAPDPAEEVPAKVMAGAGRIGGGDFRWTFNNSVDDDSYAVNEALKAALVSYKDSIVAIGSGFKDTSSTVTSTSSTTSSAASTTSAAVTTSGGTELPIIGGYIHDFTENGTSSSFFAISGNLSTSKGTVTYAGKTLTQCLKLETATSIGFTAPSDGTLTLVFVEPEAAIKLDGKRYSASGDGIITLNIGSGTHSVTKADTANLFYMVYSPSAQTSSQNNATYGDANCDDEVNLADAVLIMQTIANPAKYQLSEQGALNADVNGGGVTTMDALDIQRFMLRLINKFSAE